MLLAVGRITNCLSSANSLNIKKKVTSVGYIPLSLIRNLLNPLCFNSDGEQLNFILPMVGISVSSSNKTCLNCLGDKRSEQFYFFEFVVRNLKGKNCSVTSIEVLK